MLTFLDKRKQHKYNILSLLSLNNGDSISVSDLQALTGHSNPTLNKLMREIQEDLKKNGFSNLLKENKDGNQKRYILGNPNQVFLNTLMSDYLKNSLKFKLIIDLFYNNYENTEDLADKYFISGSTLRREISSLQKIFNDFSISIGSYSMLKLSGKEEHIRLFYTFFFSKAYQAKDWPFPELDLQILDVLKNKFPKILMANRDINTSMFICYAFAVSYQRAKQGYYIAEEKLTMPLFFDQANPEFVASHQELVEIVRENYGTVLLEDHLETELKYLYSGIFSYLETYQINEFLPAFFLLNSELKATSFIEQIYSDSYSLINTLKLEVNPSIFSTVLYKIAKINYRMAFFGKPVDASIDYFLPNSRIFKYTENFLYVNYKYIRERLDLGRTVKPKWKRELLADAYSKIGSIVLASFFPPYTINVCLVTNQEDYQYITDTMKLIVSDTEINIHFVDNHSPTNIDIVISDMALSFSTFNIPEGTPLIYFESHTTDLSVRMIVNQMIEAYWNQIA